MPYLGIGIQVAVGPVKTAQAPLRIKDVSGGDVLRKPPV